MLVGKLHVRSGPKTLCGRCLPHPGLTVIPVDHYRRTISEMCQKCEQQIWFAFMLQRLAAAPKPAAQLEFAFMNGVEHG